MIVFKFPNSAIFFSLNDKTVKYPVSFHSFSTADVLQLKGEFISLSIDEIKTLYFELPKFTGELTKDETKKDYLEKIRKSIKIINENDLDKLVIARKKTIRYDKIDFAQTFLNLCEKYPSAFVYAFSENGISWMGAFSEVLGEYNKITSEFKTMSLAGTLPIDEKWTEKEIKEQQPVTDYIENILKKYSDKVEKSATKDCISGNIKHLKTDFKLKIASENLNLLLDDLHPTPAVCGSPKDLSKKLISEIENFPRELYGGYSKIETQDYISCFVNLRCGKFYKNHAELFAGGGITPLSNPEKEWSETELKFQALGNQLCI